MKKLFQLVLCLFIYMPFYAQEFEILESIGFTFEDNEFNEDFQVVNDNAFLLSSHYNKDGRKIEYDKFIIYRLDKNFKKIENKVIETGLSMQEEMKFIGFINNTWFFFTEKEIDNFIFEYSLLSLSTNGDINKKLVKKYEFQKPVMMQLGLNGLFNEIGDKVSFDISPSKEFFLISMLLNHKSILTFIYDKEGKLQEEKEIVYIDNGEKEKTQIPSINDVYIDNKQNIYITLNFWMNKNGYNRYCFLYKGEVLLKKEDIQGKRSMSSTFFEEHGVVSILALYSNFNAIGKKSSTGDLYSVIDGQIKLVKSFDKDFEEVDYLAEQYLVNSDAKIFMSTNLIEGESQTLMRDIKLFELEDDSIKKSVNINRAAFGSRYNGGFRAKIFKFSDAYFIVFNSTEKRLGIKGGGAFDGCLFLTKINSGFKEEFTRQILTKEDSFVWVNHSIVMKNGMIIMAGYKEGKFLIMRCNLN